MHTYLPPDRLIPKTIAAVGLFILALALAGTFLFYPSLENRPMHTDEAVLAAKLGTLIEEGSWTYDPSDYHGPTLPYSTLVVSRLMGKDTYASLTKTSLRLVPALYAIGLILLLPLLSDGLGRVSIGFAAVFTAVSPMVIYYGRYFIMELPFVFFTAALVACGWRFYMTRSTGWLLAAGLFAGLTHATKETCIITFFALGTAAFLTGAVDYFVRGSGLGIINRQRKRPVRKRVVIWSLVIAAFISALLFSSFLTNPKGIIQSFTTYSSYLHRSTGSGHEQPWYFYLQILAWKKAGVIWSGLAVLLFATVGSCYAFFAQPGRNKNLHLPRFLTLYAAITLLAYSFISYKTPWSILSFHHATLILAGYGCWVMVSATRTRPSRLFVVGIIAIAATHLAFQTLRANGRFAADIRNPFVYSHTSTNFEKLVTRITTLKQLSQDPLHIEIAHPEFAWPFEFYFRDDRSIAYRASISPETAQGDLIIIDAADTGKISDSLSSTHTYDDLYGLRPDSRISLFVRKDLWEQFMKTRR